MLAEPDAPSRPPILEVRLVAVAGAPPAELDRIVGGLSRHLSVACRRASPRPELGGRELAGRGQLDADTLLVALERLADDPAAPLVGLTDRDLGLPIFTHVFGRARVGGNAAVVSLARLRPEFYGEAPDPPLLLERALAEILHELGHVAGLVHCQDANCLMHFCSRIEAADVRGSVLCDACRERLAHADGEIPPLFRRR